MPSTEMHGWSTDGILFSNQTVNQRFQNDTLFVLMKGLFIEAFTEQIYLC